MAATQVNNEEIKEDPNSISRRLKKLESDMSELKESVKRALDNLLPKVETLLANQPINVSNSFVVQTPAPIVEASGSLIQAAQVNNVETIFHLLSRDDVDVDQRNNEGDSALHVAAGAGHEHAVTLLLGGNIPVDFIGHRGRTALHCASEDGHVSVVRRLLTAGANANAKDCVGDFPLLLAAKAGHLDVVKQLKKHNASLDLVDRGGNSAIVAAAKAKHWGIVEFLVESGASTAKYKGEDNSPLYLVSKEKIYSWVKNMIKKTEQNEEQMKKALEKCYDPYLVHVFEDSAPGFCRTQQGRDAMTYMAARGKVDVLRAMLDRGADVDGFSRYGASCLMRAAYYGQVNVMKLLLERGASVNLKQLKCYQTALHWAAERGHVECVRLLLQAGATVNIKNNQSKTPIDLAKTDAIRQVLESHSSQS